MKTLLKVIAKNTTMTMKYLLIDKTQMKKLKLILNNSYRIIQFSINRCIVKNQMNHLTFRNQDFSNI